MRAILVLTLMLTGIVSPVLAADPSQIACLYAMAERLPRLPGLRIVRTELNAWGSGLARTAPIGMQRKAIGGHIVTDLGGNEASYAVICSLLIDRRGAVEVEAERSSLRLEGVAGLP